jgi:hypothetical protein
VRLSTLLVLSATAALGLAVQGAAAPPAKVIGTKRAALVRIVADDSGYTPSNIAVHAGARVTLRWTVKASRYGHGLYGRLFRIDRIDVGKTGVATFRAPAKPGTVITFDVRWPNENVFKYKARISVVR